MTAQQRTRISRREFTSRLLALLLAAATCILTGCGPKITIAWDTPKPGLHDGTALRLASVEVGHVTDARAENGHFAVEARINRKHADTVKADSTFIVRPAQGVDPAYIEIVTLRPESPPIADGAILQGSESETGAKLRTLTVDWRRTALMAGLGVVILALGIVLAKVLAKAWATLFCLSAGAAGAYFVSPHTLPYLSRWVPAEFRPDLLAYVAGFFLAYLAALIVVLLLRAPAAAAQE